MFLFEKYEKMIMTKDLEMQKKKFTIEGRKIPLDEIRTATFREHAPYMRENKSDNYYENLTEPQTIARLTELHEYNQDETLTGDE